MIQLKWSKFSSFQNGLLSPQSQLREKQTIAEVKTINEFRFVAVKLWEMFSQQVARESVIQRLLFYSKKTRIPSFRGVIRVPVKSFVKSQSSFVPPEHRARLFSWKQSVLVDDGVGVGRWKLKGPTRPCRCCFQDIFAQDRRFAFPG